MLRSARRTLRSLLLACTSGRQLRLLFNTRKHEARKLPSLIPYPAISGGSQRAAAARSAGVGQTRHGPGPPAEHAPFLIAIAASGGGSAARRSAPGATRESQGRRGLSLRGPDRAGLFKIAAARPAALCRSLWRSLAALRRLQGCCADPRAHQGALDALGGLQPCADRDQRAAAAAGGAATACCRRQRVRRSCLPMLLKRMAALRCRSQQ